MEKACACNGKEDEAVLMARLDAVIKEQCHKPGGLIPALQMAQGIFGYLPQPVLQRISQGFSKPCSEIAGIVSFYSFFSTQPRGKYLIRVCLGTACYVRGGKGVLEEVRKVLGVDVGETTADGLFTLEVARCFGSCGLAPVMMVNDTIHQRVKQARIRELINQYRQEGAKEGSHA